METKEEKRFAYLDKIDQTVLDGLSSLQTIYVDNVQSEMCRLARLRNYKFIAMWTDQYYYSSDDFTVWVEPIDLPQGYNVWKDEPNDEFFKIIGDCCSDETFFLNAFLKAIGDDCTEASSIQINSYKAALDSYLNKSASMQFDEWERQLFDVLKDYNQISAERALKKISGLLLRAGKKASALFDRFGDCESPNPLYFDLVDALAQTQLACEALMEEQNV